MSPQREQSGKQASGTLLNAQILRAQGEVRCAQRALDSTGGRVAELAVAAMKLELLRREQVE
ncbi:hypothetical protein DM867_10950 [Halosegnis rubeus]|uniref:Uncharacterized protein n=1 Tax=Halosegnis rubeus TaxID=2212850 RepID=A0A5N5UFZ7_9EURY|nr:hypothetical protein [Halosegnis rubeus]KAB7513021.1 hypothetical protein DM867_10950 [Halosegnis rubeus]KAB7513121.1 hypothetical protein DMP03_12945 [Halosegnis rubeus]KAB7516611.1 hypothetical protein DP108_10830 [Halosegnis rubeus]